MTAIDHRRSFSMGGATRGGATAPLARPMSHPVASALVCVIMAAGLALRLAAAQGDLWVDELWSLHLVSHLSWPGQAFWALPHDNNHPLNSVWLALVGPDRSPVVYRLPAVLFGTATVGAAAWQGWRINPAAAVAAATLAAFCYPFVLYGSEARGFAGLILAVVLAYAIWARLVERLEAGIPLEALRASRWRLAAVALFGAASHFTMLGAIAVLGAATVLRRWRQRGPVGAVDESMTLFRPMLILLTPLILGVAAGAVSKGGFTIGDTTPFAPGDFVQGYGDLLAAFLGVRSLFPAAAALLAAAALVAGGFASRLIDKQMATLALTACVLLPAALFIARIGNTGFPRYFLVAGLVLPLLLAEMAGRLWVQGRPARVGAGLLVVLPCLGQVPDLRLLLVAHRGAPTAAMALIEPGAVVRLGDAWPFAVGLVGAHVAKAGQHRLVPHATALPCEAPPDWLFDASASDDVLPLQVTDGGPSCPMTYRLVRGFPTTAWAGQVYSVYRRVAPQAVEGSGSAAEP